MDIEVATTVYSLNCQMQFGYEGSQQNVGTEVAKTSWTRTMQTQVAE
jgi:hypothetical protein